MLRSRNRTIDIAYLHETEPRVPFHSAYILPTFRFFCFLPLSSTTFPQIDVNTTLDATQQSTTVARLERDSKRETHPPTPRLARRWPVSCPKKTPHHTPRPLHGQHFQRHPA